MADHTGIEWCDATWNPIVGCQIVSPGCTNCYAMDVAARLLDGNPKAPHYKGTTKRVNDANVWTGRVALASQRILTQPLRWSRPRRIFVNSMGDLFADGVEEAWLDQVFAVMAKASRHTFLVLTKRPERAREYVAGALVRLQERLYSTDKLIESGGQIGRGVEQWPLPNLWLGVSVEDQRRADERIPVLLDTPAAVRWISAEPLLGPVDLTRVVLVPSDAPERGKPPVSIDALQGSLGGCDDRTRLDWVVAGGESGRGARPMHPDWARSLRDQCAAAGVPFFFKQWGEWQSVDQIADAEIDALYEPAPERDPEATRCCRVEKGVLRADGRLVEVTDPGAFLQGTRSFTVFRRGKARAGRHLDGVTHDAFPEARP